MNRYGLMLTLLLFCAVESLAQRYGRPDAAQNYGRVQNPQILLQVKVDKKSLYFRSSDLQKMQRSTVKLHDLTTNTSHTYEGVSLEVLLSKRTHKMNSGSIEVSFGKHQSTSILSDTLDPATVPIVVDTVDGTGLTGYVPYCLIVKTREGKAQLIKNVTRIRVG